LKKLFIHLPIILIEYGINTPRKSISQSTSKLGEMITVISISICIGSPNNWRTGKDSKRQLRRQNVTSLTKNLPTKIMAPKSS